MKRTLYTVIVAVIAMVVIALIAAPRFALAEFECSGEWLTTRSDLDQGAVYKDPSSDSVPFKFPQADNVVVLSPGVDYCGVGQTAGHLWVMISLPLDDSTSHLAWTFASNFDEDVPGTVPVVEPAAQPTEVVPTQEATVAPPTATLPSTLAPTAVPPVEPTVVAQAQAEEVMQIVLPTLPQDLPNGLPPGVSHQAPEMPDCQGRMNMQEPCSTLIGQAVEGDFDLGGVPRPHMKVVNGDAVHMTDANGQPILPNIPVAFSGTNHDMWLLYAADDLPAVTVHMDAGFGSNREDFFAAFPSTTYSDEDVAGLLGFKLRQILVRSDVAEDACQPGVEDCYPQFINPRNCAAIDDPSIEDVVTYCDVINIYVVQWDGTNWTTVMYGIYGLVRDQNGQATEARYLDLRDRINEFAEAAG